MEVIRAKITGWTASFRYPIFVSGFQPTLDVPPVSTIYGLLSAVKGKAVEPNDTKVGFIFKSLTKSVDLETIYELGKKPLQAKSNVIKREFLAEPEMYLYLTNTAFKEYLEKPHYQLLLGRSSDLAMVSEVKEILLSTTIKATYRNTLLPFNFGEAHGAIQALPTHFTEDIPRKPLGTQIYYIITEDVEIEKENQFVDPEFGWGVYFHPE